MAKARPRFDAGLKDFTKKKNMSQSRKVNCAVGEVNLVPQERVRQLFGTSRGESARGRAVDLRAGAGGGWSCWWARQCSAALWLSSHSGGPSLLSDCNAS